MANLKKTTQIQKLKQSKFLSSLTESSSGIKEKRASILERSTELAMNTAIQEKQQKVNDLEIKIENLTDLSPENTYSLRPGNPDFNEKEWVKELLDSKLELKIAEMELEVAMETKEEWFGK
jgi:hypothetical protein